MKKRILALLMAGALALGLTACGGGDTSTDADTTADSSSDTAAATGIAADKLKVGLILVGEAADAYNKNHIDGMREACKKNGMDYDSQVVVKANITEDSTCADAINELLDAGCNAIFADSFGHEQYMEEAAPDHPDVQFCHATGYQGATDTLDNTHNYFAKIFEARYLAGIAAGLKTETNKLGYVAAKPFAEVISGYTAFYLGAKSVNPDVTMYVNYTNEWSDATKEATNAQALIDQGCDVISQHSDTSAPATTAQNNGVFAVGYNDDMIPVAPDAALVSARVNWGAYYEYALKCLIDGEEIDRDWCKGYAEGAVYTTELNDSIVAPGTAEKVAELEAGFKAGTVKVFDTANFTVNGETVTTYLADVDDLGDYVGETEVIENGEFLESYYRSAPYFDLDIDGITNLDA